jgi:hypothetical protein
MELTGADLKLLPDCFESLEEKAVFRFDCHKNLPCFTECCRLLDLELSPYDLLRLRHATGLNSAVFLDRYVIIEDEVGEFFPRLFLAMVDDGRASCPFVSKQGCSVYADRPSACRTYPLGRGFRRLASGRSEERFILVRESHCLGFTAEKQQTAGDYCVDQGLEDYHHLNEEMASILNNPGIIKRGPLAPEERATYILFLYDLDTLRFELLNGRISGITPLSAQRLASSIDKELLRWAIEWLARLLFP